LIWQILNAVDTYFQSIRENSNELNLKETPENAALTAEENELNTKRMFICLYIFERIAHGYSDSMILHAANIIINTVNKSASKFGLEQVEEL